MGISCSMLTSVRDYSMKYIYTFLKFYRPNTSKFRYAIFKCGSTHVYICSVKYQEFAFKNAEEVLLIDLKNYKEHVLHTSVQVDLVPAYVRNMKHVHLYM